MGKGKKVLGRLFATILVSVFMVVAVILMLSFGPCPTLYAEGKLTSNTYVILLAVVGFYGIFGGTDISTKWSLTVTGSDGTQNGSTNDTTISLAMDYYALIALILVVLAVVVFLIFYRNKIVGVITGILCLGGAILGGCESLTFSAVNGSLQETLESLNALGIAFNNVQYVVLGIGSICFAVIMGIIAIYMIVHALRLKK